MTVNSPGSAPSATVTTPSSGTHSGDVTINYTLTDANSDPCDILVQFSTDGGVTWQNATAADVNETENLSSSPSSSGQAHQYLWASGLDIFDAHNSDVEISITPTDTVEDVTGSTVVTSTFSVDNSQFPRPVISGVPSTVTVGTPFSVTVTMENSAGATIPSSDPLNFYSSDTHAVLSDDPNGLPEGFASFPVTLNTAGPQWIAVDDSVNGAASKVYLTVLSGPPSVTPNPGTAMENTPLTGLVVAPATADAPWVTYFQITAINGGSLALNANDGGGQISDGQFIPVAQGSNGLTFTPTADSLTAGGFTIQESTSDDVTGLGGSTTTDSIAIDSPILLSPSSLPTGPVNVPYNQTITASGGTGEKTLTVSIQNAIPGLNVPLSGTNALTITGTPTATGTENFTVTATDMLGGATTPTLYSITVTLPLATPLFSGLLGRTITYGTASTILGGTISLVPDTESVSVTLNDVTQLAPVDGSGNFSSSFDTHALGVGESPYSITYSYAGDANLNPVSDTTKLLTVTQATPTVNVTDIGGTYNASPFAATATVTGVGGIPAPSLEGVSPTLTYYIGTGTNGQNLGSTAPINAGTYTAVASFPGSVDYMANNGQVAFTIAKANLTVTAAANTKTYDGTTSAAALPTITSGALQGSDTATWTETYDTKNVGTGETLVPTGTVSDGNGGKNYNVTFVNSTSGVIATRALTVTATANTKTYDGTTSAAAAPTITFRQSGPRRHGGVDRNVRYQERGHGENAHAVRVGERRQRREELQRDLRQQHQRRDRCPANHRNRRAQHQGLRRYDQRGGDSDDYLGGSARERHGHVDGDLRYQERGHR